MVLHFIPLHSYIQTHTHNELKREGDNFCGQDVWMSRYNYNCEVEVTKQFIFAVLHLYGIVHLISDTINYIKFYLK